MAKRSKISTLPTEVRSWLDKALAEGNFSGYEQLEKLLTDRKIALDLDKDAIEWLANKGYDPAYGARPLKRVIQKELQDPLAEKILGGDILDGSTVKITAGSDRLNFRSRPSVAKSGKKDAEYTWVIDPLDGTTNFIHGIPQFAVSIGF